MQEIKDNAGSYRITLPPSVKRNAAGVGKFPLWHPEPVGTAIYLYHVDVIASEGS
jgi:hypothetical protein